MDCVIGGVIADSHHWCYGLETPREVEIALFIHSIQQPRGSLDQGNNHVVGIDHAICTVRHVVVNLSALHELDHEFLNVIVSHKLH